MVVVDRLVKLSQGFPFLAEELLREAKADFTSSMLGSAKAPAEMEDTGNIKERIIAKDPYTPEELLALNEFYGNYKRDAGWEIVSVEGGVEFFSRPNDTGTIRQGKAVGIIPNCTPLELLDTLVGAQLDEDHWSRKSDSERGSLKVLEVKNDHSGVVYYTIPFPSPFQDRETVSQFVWKEMEPGKILFLARSIEHEECPRNSRYVRFDVKFRAYVLTKIPNTNSTREELLLMGDPGVSSKTPCHGYIFIAHPSHHLAVAGHDSCCSCKFTRRQITVVCQQACRILRSSRRKRRTPPQVARQEAHRQLAAQAAAGHHRDHV
jgi:hypothetical protein